ncbi:MAG: DNA polymerase I [Candidatus Margulisbacteria bacterium]|jgi:DNA polymerase-1|nr:DNA polymerase I [Candidatus Margulisiibacteriota bacterium]
MATTASRVFLIDGNSLAYRAFYALPDTMRTATGITTNAVYGFTSMLLKLLDEKPDYVAIAFDRPEPTFRHKEYKEYKATRQKAPPTLHEQLPFVKEVAAALNIPVFELPGYEADDIIGTLAVTAARAGHDVEIISGDLDGLQLVNDRIRVLTTRKGITDTILYGAKEVAERYDGLRPDQLIDYKALKGDTSDNIPGVPKVGEKTAIELLKEFGTLENIYANLDKIKKPALRENLKNNLPLAEMSRRLGTIVTNVPVPTGLERLKRREIDWATVIPLFQQLEFNSLVKKYASGAAELPLATTVEKKRTDIAKLNYRCVQSEADRKALLTELEQADAFCFDLETTSLDVFTAQIVGIAFSTKGGSAWYMPSSPTLDPTTLRPLFASPQLKIGHNLKYDIAVLRNNGIEVVGPYFDTMVAAYLLDPSAGKYGLKFLAKQFLGREMLNFEEVSGGKSFADVPLDLATDYAGSDADATFSLYELFQLALTAQKMDKLMAEIEMPLLAALIAMERNGIAIDSPLLAKMSGEIALELKELERHIFAIAGEVFNLNSPKQLSQILFTKLQLPVKRRTKSGPSTDAEVLEELAGESFEIAEKLLAYRQLSKLKSTYIDVLPTLVNQRTGRLHTSFNQTIAATGRLSSSEPNLQNIPARLKPAFIPGEKGWAMVDADYSQIELRVLAQLSGDPLLIKAFQEGRDVHQATADELGISRAAAKTVNFGVIYGQSDFGLARQLKIKRTEAAAYIEKYFRKYQGVRTFLDRTIKEARENGYVTTLLGRKRPLADINSPHGGLRAAAERMAINAPVQGSAADLIKIAMVNVNSKLQSKKSKCRMLLQVHDELLFECPVSEVAEVRELVRTAMEQALELAVPVKVEVGSGENWAAAKPG